MNHRDATLTPAPQSVWLHRRHTITREGNTYKVFNMDFDLVGAFASLPLARDAIDAIETSPE